MKEIHAYVRANMANHVIEVLTKFDHLDFSIVTVRGITKGLQHAEYIYSVRLGELVEDVIKIELVCKDDDVLRLAETIRHAASTGKKGDGMIFIAPIEEAIRISSGERGERALIA